MGRQDLGSSALPRLLAFLVVACGGRYSTTSETDGAGASSSAGTRGKTAPPGDDEPSGGVTDPSIPPSTGGVSTGTVEVKDGVLTFPNEKYTGPDGKSQTLRTVWQHKGDHEYVAVTEEEKAGKWVEAWRIDFKRVAGTSAPSGVKPGT